MTTLKKKESVLSQHHLGLKEMEYYTMRSFTEADRALPDHDCFCALLIHYHNKDLSTNEETDTHYAAMGYFFVDEQQFYFGFPKNDGHTADPDETSEFSVHWNLQFRDSPCKEDWADMCVDVLAWCEIDAFSATGEEK